ncbi:hypothetical protein V2J09_023573 [Rumex salicifolius]
MDKNVEAQPFEWVEDFNEKLSGTRRKRRRTKRKKFVGWGSEQLISFLQSIGKSTEEKMSQHDVTSIINQYINDNNLIDPVKKKNFVCDKRLRPIFGKKSIGQIRVFELLESHYAENENSSDNEGYSSDEREEDKHVSHRPQKDSTSEEKALKRKKAAEALKSCFAAIIPENIKAVYLKKTLVLELLKNPDSFEGKVLGSYVRVKADRYDYKQKNSHVLQIVTGIKKDAEDVDSVRLKIADMGKHINLSELSEIDFSEEECKDLHRRIQEGLLKQPTVAELQEKVQLLHEDITKHRKLLQTPAEQSRLLQTVPEVIAEELKLESVPANTEDCPENVGTDAVSITDWVISNDSPRIGYTTTSGGASPKAEEPDSLKVEAETNYQLQPPKEEVECAVEKPLFQAVENGNSLSFDLNNGAGSSPKQAEMIHSNESLDFNEVNTRVDSSAKQFEVIDLSDDDEEEDKIWHYVDPQGEVQGPFSIMQLKKWTCDGFFHTGFTVWKSGQSQNQQILLCRKCNVGTKDLVIYPVKDINDKKYMNGTKYSEN